MGPGSTNLVDKKSDIFFSINVVSSVIDVSCLDTLITGTSSLDSSYGFSVFGNCKIGSSASAISLLSKRAKASYLSSSNSSEIQ
jgi:hypothetical protein